MDISQSPLTLQKVKFTKLYYLLSLISFVLFIGFGIATGMDIRPSLIALGLVLPIGLLIFFKKEIEIAGVILFIVTNIISTGIAVYFGGFFSNTIYFIPLIFAYSVYILPHGKLYLIIVIPTLMLDISILWLSQGTTLNQVIFSGDEFQKIMAFTVIIVLSIQILVNNSYYNLAHKITSELVKERDKAKESDFKRKKLISILFHDLSNNLTASLYRLTPKSLELVAGSKGYSNAKVGIENLKMMKELLEHVRVLEKYSGEVGIVSELVSLKKVIEGSLLTFGLRISEKGVFVKLDIQTDKVTSNRQSLQFNILNNFLSNALKYSKRGDKITVSTGETGKGFSLSVTNPSSPIPQEVKNSMFDIKNQCSTRGTDGERGNGFGLAIASEMAKRLGGRIDVIESDGLVTFSYIQS